MTHWKQPGQDWAFIGIDSGRDDRTIEVEVEFGSDGKPLLRTWRDANPPRPKVERMTRLYGAKWKFVAGDTIDLKKGKDGTWR